MVSPLSAPQMQWRMPGLGTAGGPPTGGGSSSAGVATSGWNPNDATSGILFRGPGIYSTQSSVEVEARGIRSLATGLVYLEFMYLGTGSRGANCGVANAAENLNNGNGVGGTSNSFGVTPVGNITYNNAIVASLPAAFNGSDVCGFAINIGAKQIYVSQNGVWMGGGTPGNGATAYTGPTGPLYPAFSGYFKYDGLVMFTGGGGFTFGPPTGYSAWG